MLCLLHDLGADFLLSLTLNCSLRFTIPKCLIKKISFSLFFIVKYLFNDVNFVIVIHSNFLGLFLNFNLFSIYYITTYNSIPKSILGIDNNNSVTLK